MDQKTSNQIKKCKSDILNFYAKNKRILPWREHIDPYHVVISEIMLQQTQVPRVLIKFPQFLSTFPSFHSLAESSVKDVLSVWQGLGYNRRALYLRQIAQIVVNDYHGILPQDPTLIDAFPGVGPATAASIICFTYNLPTIFIETNIRRVFIHFFFPDRDEVDDNEIYPLVSETVDTENPREWYYALMDYGTMLAKKVKNPNKRSKHYSVQSKFLGSDRQIRGEIVRQTLAKESVTIESISNEKLWENKRVEKVFSDLVNEGFLVKDEEKYKVR
jgi:A/G-specific adenine glycosylase